MRSFYHSEKKIALPIALILLITLLISISFGIQKVKTFSTNAKTHTRGATEITNITPHSATIIWETDIKTNGWVAYGTNKNFLTTYGSDDRDVANHKNMYTQHYVSLKNLNENTTYFFKIASNQQVQTSTNHNPFFFKTTPQLSLRESIKPAFGKSMNANGTPLSEGIVFLKIDGATPLSTLTKTTGEWLIPLYHLTNKNTMKLFMLTAETPLTIEIRNEDGEKALITTTIAQISPVPHTIVMGQQREYTDEKINVLADSTRIASMAPTTFDIIFPKQNAIIPGKRPIIKGVALPSSTIVIQLYSKTKTHTFTLKSNKDGIWSFTPSYDLPEEKHTITMTTHDINNTRVTKTHVFTIAKSGESVLGEATPSATITQTPIPTILPTNQPSIIPTNTPSPPVTGINQISISFIGAGLFILGLGCIMLF